MGVGASSVKTDDPSKDDGNSFNDYNPPKSENSQNQSQENSQTSSKQNSGKNKSSQTGNGKQCGKKLDTLGGYAG